MKHRPIVAALAGLALVAGLAGCSSSDSSGTATTTTAAPTSTAAGKDATTTTGGKAGSGTSEVSVAKAAFLQDGNALCAQMNQDLAAAQAKLPGGKPTTGAEVASFLQTNIDIISATLVKLRALTPPPGDEAQVDALLGAAEAMIPYAQQAQQAAAAGDQATFEQVGAQMDAQNKKANQLANAYGLTECGKGSK